MTSALSRCRQSALRPCLRSGGGGAAPGRRPASGARPAVELLGPQHAGQRLALHEPGIGVRHAALQRGVERVGLAAAAVHRRRRTRRTRRPSARGRSRSRSWRCRRPAVPRAVGRAFGAAPQRADRGALAVHHAVVDAVLERAGACRRTAGRSWSRSRRTATRRPRPPRRPAGAQAGWRALTRAPSSRSSGFGRPGSQDQSLRAQSCGRMCSGAGVRPAIVHGDLHQDVVGGRLGVFDLDVEIAALVEDAGVHQLELPVRHAARAFSATSRS